MVLAATTASCGSLTAPGEPESLRHEVRPAHLVLTNQTGLPVFHMVVEETLLPLINWVPCADPAFCAPIAPGSSVELAFEGIPGHGAESERVVVFWWHAEGARDGVQAMERVQGFTVQLR